MNFMCKKSIPDELDFWDDLFQEDPNDFSDGLSTVECVKKSRANNVKFNISSYVPSIKIKHYDNLRCLLYTDHFNSIDSDWVFRGHKDHNWSLASTLERIGSKSLELRENHLNRFRKECRRTLKENTHLLDLDENEFWAMGQHYGLATPLLDWSYSPYVALFFAFEDKVDEEDYRVIYALNRGRISRELPEFSAELFFEPKVDPFGRLTNQSGMFTIAPPCTTLEDSLIDTLRSNGFIQPVDIAGFICKIYIKSSAKSRSNCLNDLRNMNIHNGTLFPDLIGAAKYCNQITKEQYGVDC